MNTARPPRELPPIPWEPSKPESLRFPPRSGAHGPVLTLVPVGEALELPEPLGPAMWASAVREQQRQESRNGR
jgi:hypothetical protein